MAQGPEENSGRAGRMAGLVKVVIAMSPILADEQRPVGRAWPAAEKPAFGRERKRKVSGHCRALARARIRLRQDTAVPMAKQRLTPRKAKLLIFIKSPSGSLLITK